MERLNRVSWDLPTLAEMRSKPMACPKGKSRLELKAEAAPDDKTAEARFRHAVRKRDRMKCRKCGRQVVLTIAHVPERAEVHHLHGRLGDFRYDDTHALLLCNTHHEQVTGAVAKKLFILQIARDMLKVGEKWLIDARKPVQFKEAS